MICFWIWGAVIRDLNWALGNFKKLLEKSFEEFFKLLYFTAYLQLFNFLAVTELLGMLCILILKKNYCDNYVNTLDYYINLELIETLDYLEYYLEYWLEYYLEYYLCN